MRSKAKRQLVEMANGDSWWLIADQNAMELLEELYEGAPFIAVVGDTEDLSTSRLNRLLFALSVTFREDDGGTELRNLSYKDFKKGPWLPVDEDEDRDRLAGQVNELLNLAFPQAIKKGRGLLMVVKEARKLGLMLDGFSESSESRTGDDPAHPDMPTSPTSFPSTGFSVDTMAGSSLV